MSIDRNDPRLSAYALGELSPEDARTFEALLAGDPAARDEVAALRDLAGRLERELALEPMPALLAAQRERLAAAAGRPAPRARAWWPAFAAAAGVLVLVGAMIAVLRPTYWGKVFPSEDLARVREDEAPARGSRAQVAGSFVRSDPAPSGPSPQTEGDELYLPAEQAARLRSPGLEGGGAGVAGAGAGGVAAGPVSGRGDLRETPGYGGPGGAVPPGQREPRDPSPPPSSPPSGPPAGGPATGLPPPEPDGSAPDSRLGSVARGERPSAGGPDPSVGGGAEAEAHGARPPFHTEGYDRLRDNPFVRVADEDASTFSIDVDTASYANARRFLIQQGRLPPPDAVRIEELVNYFPYDYAPPAPGAEHPFAAHVVVADCPWAPEHRLVRVALKGKVMQAEERPAANLVFLCDVSGSMRPANKLGLLKQALQLLVPRLEARDRVAIVVYAGAAGLVLPPTAGDRQDEILAALERLRSGGSTNGGAGIQLAYDVARRGFIQGGVNRVILCTDGDFNVGVSDRGGLTRLIEEQAGSGVFLTVLGFGMGNLKDDRMEELSNRGNGNYGYVDSLKEARKLLVDEGLGTLVTIAKDVKIQIFFNPRKVAGWRLIGYENRLLRREDFNDDRKDAGEIGAGHAVTALYELVPAGQVLPGPVADPNPFLSPRQPQPETGEALLRLRLRYKQPAGDTSTLMEHDVLDTGLRFEQTDDDYQWAAAVAGFGMLLRDSPYKGQVTWALVEEVAQAARGADREGYRAEFLELVRRAAVLSSPR